VIDTNTSAPAEQAKSTKFKRLNPRACCMEIRNGTCVSPTSTQSVLQLQPDVGNHFAFSQVMMKRMDFYEKQTELFWNAKEDAELIELLASYRQQVQQPVHEQTNPSSTSLLDQLTLTTFNNNIYSNKNGSEIIHHIRYQRQLSLTYKELWAQ
jgi:hypothetical protein